MKEITIRFNGLGCNKYYQANILIYDDFNNLVYSGQTYNGEIKLKLLKNKVYKMYADSLNEKLIISFYVKDNNIYCFSFERNVIRINSIIFLLTDYYYNLPIERGELILWQEQ